MCFRNMNHMMSSLANSVIYPHVAVVLSVSTSNFTGLEILELDLPTRRLYRRLAGCLLTLVSVLAEEEIPPKKQPS